MIYHNNSIIGHLHQFLLNLAYVASSIVIEKTVYMHLRYASSKEPSSFTLK